MFKNKYLKRLQDVQARIRNCTATVASLKPPTPDTVTIYSNVRRWLNSLMSGCYPNIELMFGGEFGGSQKRSLDYLEKLGTYLINIANYEKEKEVCEQELKKLQAAERFLKRKLGID